jgi:ankyrin repeat protein
MKTIMMLLLASCVVSLAQTNPHNADSTSSKTPAYEATAHLMNALQFGGNLEAIKSLLEQGADVNAHDNDGSHALQLAAKRGDLEIVRLLLVNGADVNATNSSGYTALDSATYRGFVDIAKILVEKGAAVDKKGSDGGTALMSAAWSGQTNAVAFLLDKGANINATNWSGDTALRNAVDQNNTEVVKILLARGANVNVENFLNQTALDDAKRNNNSVIVQLLQQAGATKSSSARLDEAMSDDLKEMSNSFEKSTESMIVLSNALRNFPQPDSVPSPVAKLPVIAAAPEMPVNPVVASGTNTDRSGYVTNTDLLTPFTLTNSVGDVITNAVLVKLMANKFIYKAPSGGGMMSLSSLPENLQAKFGYDPQSVQAADEADQQKKAR